MKLIFKTLIFAVLIVLIGCTANESAMDELTTRAHRTTEPTDTTASSSGINFDLSDTVMEEETEWITFDPEGWDEVGMDVDFI